MKTNNQYFDFSAVDLTYNDVQTTYAFQDYKEGFRVTYENKPERLFLNRSSSQSDHKKYSSLYTIRVLIGLDSLVQRIYCKND